mgnify:CR=1 FL=1
MDTKTLGLILLAIYSYVNNNPVKRVGAILQSFDPSYYTFQRGAPSQSKWRARLQLGIHNGAQITILALILKLTGLLNYPFSDRAWMIFGITLIVLMTAANIFVNKWFYTNDLEKPSETTAAAYLFSLLVILANDLGDLLIVGLLIVSTVRQSMFKDWMPAALLIFFAVVLVAVMTHELFRPSFLEDKNLWVDRQYRILYPWQWASEDDKCSSTPQQSCIDDGYVYSLYLWFTGDMFEYRNNGGNNGINTAIYNHMTPRFVSKLVLTVAVILLTGKSI